MSDIFIPLGGSPVDLDAVTAGAGDVLAGKVIVGPDGEPLTGTMPNRGAVSQSLAINGSYTIPAGYHNGSGKVSQKVTTKGAQTFTPGTTNQTIAANQFLTGVQTILGDPNLIGANIIQGKTIFGVPGSAVEYKSPSNLSEKPVLAWNKGGSIEISIDTEAGLGLKNKTGNYILVKLNAGNAVNLSGWKYLKASIRLSTYAGNGKCYLGVSTNPSLQAFSFNASWAMDWVVNSSNTYAPAIDISSLNGTYFIYYGLQLTANGLNDLTVNADLTGLTLSTT